MSQTAQFMQQTPQNSFQGQPNIYPPQQKPVQQYQYKQGQGQFAQQGANINAFAQLPQQQQYANQNQANNGYSYANQVYQMQNQAYPYSQQMYTMNNQSFPGFSANQQMNLQNQNYAFKTQFPRLEDYSKIESIREKFPESCQQLNDLSFDPEKLTKGYFFIITSTNDDNVHKAIKYGVWTSSPSNCETLNKAFNNTLDSNILNGSTQNHENESQNKKLENNEDKKQEDNKNQEEKPEVYLFYCVKRSGQFLGVAKMTSEFRPEESFKYWWEELKWFGSFKLTWVYLADIRDEKFKEIRGEKDNKPVSEMPDCSRINLEQGKTMLKIFKNSISQPKFDSIFGDFHFMDIREDQLRERRESPEFDEQFILKSQEFAKDPQSFKRPSSNATFKKNRNFKQNYKNKQFQQQQYMQYYAAMYQQYLQQNPYYAQQQQQYYGYPQQQMQQQQQQHYQQNKWNNNYNNRHQNDNQQKNNRDNNVPLEQLFRVQLQMEDKKKKKQNSSDEESDQQNKQHNEAEKKE